MRRSAMCLQALLCGDHNVRTIGEGQGQSKERYEGVSGPCTMTKSQRPRRWKPLKLRSQVKTQRNCVNELKLIQIRRRISSLLECWGWLQKENISSTTASVKLNKTRKRSLKVWRRTSWLVFWALLTMIILRLNSSICQVSLFWWGGSVVSSHSILQPA